MLTPQPLSEIEADGLGVSFFGLYPQLYENGRICAQLRVQICGGVCATRRLHKPLRTADRDADDSLCGHSTLSS